MSHTNEKPGTLAESPEDLLILERRGLLTESQRRRLYMCLTASDSLRLMRQMGGVFDDMPHEMAGDAALTEQLASSLTRLSYVNATRRGPARNLIRGLVAALMLVSIAATAAVVSWQRSAHRAPTLKAAIREPRAPLMPSAKARLSAAPQPSSESGEGALPSEVQSVSDLPPMASSSAVAPAAARSASRVRESDPAVAQPAAGSPAELFSAANGLRRQGQVSEASRLYRQLQHQFPRSDEAGLSYVMLARLDLARGALASALAEFDAYLNRVPRGSLEQEALHGKAQTLSRMGRAQEQQAVLNELQTRYPNSVYAVKARPQQAP